MLNVLNEDYTTENEGRWCSFLTEITLKEKDGVDVLNEDYAKREGRCSTFLTNFTLKREGRCCSFLTKITLKGKDDVLRS